jgi:hypothetical protein
VQHVAPGLAALAVAFELSQRPVQEPLLFWSRAMPLEQVALLEFAEPLEHLRPLFGLELGQFGKDFGFTHDGNVLWAEEGGKLAKR